MKNDQVVTDQSHKPRRAKSREVSSWFLSSPTTTETTTLPSPNHPISPVRRKPVSPFSDDRKPKTQLDDSGPTRGLWPSSNSSHKKLDTLADHLGNNRREDRVQRKDSIFDRGRSCMQVAYRECFRVYNNPNITLHFNTEAVDIISNTKGQMSGILIRKLDSGEESVIEAKGLFYGIGHSPNSQLLEGQVELDSSGYVLVEEGTAKTSVEGRGEEEEGSYGGITDSILHLLKKLFGGNYSAVKWHSFWVKNPTGVKINSYIELGL